MLSFLHSELANGPTSRTEPGNQSSLCNVLVKGNCRSGVLKGGTARMCDTVQDHEYTEQAELAAKVVICYCIGQQVSHVQITSDLPIQAHWISKPFIGMMLH